MPPRPPPRPLRPTPPPRPASTGALVSAFVEDPFQEEQSLAWDVDFGDLTTKLVKRQSRGNLRRLAEWDVECEANSGKAGVEGADGAGEAQGRENRVERRASTRNHVKGAATPVPPQRRGSESDGDAGVTAALVDSRPRSAFVPGELRHLQAGRSSVQRPSSLPRFENSSCTSENVITRPVLHRASSSSTVDRQSRTLSQSTQRTTPTPRSGSQPPDNHNAPRDISEIRKALMDPIATRRTVTPAPVPKPKLQRSTPEPGTGPIFSLLPPKSPPKATRVEPSSPSGAVIMQNEEVPNPRSTPTALRSTDQELNSGSRVHLASRESRKDSPAPLAFTPIVSPYSDTSLPPKSPTKPALTDERPASSIPRYEKSPTRETPSITLLPLPSRSLDLSHGKQSHLWRKILAREALASARPPSHSSPALERLYFSNNQLRELPAKEMARIAPKLTWLDISFNCVEEVPEELWSTLRKCEVLDLRSNRISNLPQTPPPFYLTLRRLLLFKNNLTEIPRALFLRPLKALTRLDVSSNSLTSLPDSISETSLPALEYLDVSRNELVELPPGVARLPHLAELRAHHNRFETLPGLDGLASLRHLNLSSNHNLSRLPNLPVFLEVLDCSDCASLAPPLTFTRPPDRLRWLNLTGTRIGRREGEAALIEVATLEVAEMGQGMDETHSPKQWFENEPDTFSWSRIQATAIADRPALQPASSFSMVQSNASSSDTLVSTPISSTNVTKQPENEDNPEDLEEELSRVRKQYLELVARVKEAGNGTSGSRGQARGKRGKGRESGASSGGSGRSEGSGGSGGSRVSGKRSYG